jgi:hypothetical protein
VGRSCPAARSSEIGIRHYVEMGSSEAINQEMRPLGQACVGDENVASCHGNLLAFLRAALLHKVTGALLSDCVDGWRLLAVINKEAQMARLIRVDGSFRACPGRRHEMAVIEALSAQPRSLAITSTTLVGERPPVSGRSDHPARRSIEGVMTGRADDHNESSLLLVSSG